MKSSNLFSRSLWERESGKIYYIDVKQQRDGVNKVELRLITILFGYRYLIRSQVIHFKEINPRYPDI